MQNCFDNKFRFRNEIGTYSWNYGAFKHQGVRGVIRIDGQNVTHKFREAASTPHDELAFNMNLSVTFETLIGEWIKMTTSQRSLSDCNI